MFAGLQKKVSGFIKEWCENNDVKDAGMLLGYFIRTRA